MDRYELVEGTSSKFWEVEVSGAELTVRFGRIGTAGQSKTKDMGSAAAAEKERDKLVKEKTGKGYTGVNTEAPRGTTAAVPAPSPRAGAVAAAASRTGPASATAPASSSAAPTTASAVQAAAAVPLAWAPATEPLPPSAAPVHWPAGGYNWDARLRSLIPVLRGLHVDEGAALADPLAEIPVFDDLGPYRVHANPLERLGKLFGQRWTHWGSLSGHHLTPAAFERKEEDFWAQVFAQAASSQWNSGHLSWSMRACLALNGPAFALGAAGRVWDAQQKTGLRLIQPRELFDPLRRAIAHADDATYTAALAVAEALRGENPELERVCCYVFAHLGEWADASWASWPADPHGLIGECALSEAAFLSYTRTIEVWARDWRPAVLLHVHLHGEGACPALESLLARSYNKETLRAALQLAQPMRSSQMLRLLVRHLGELDVRAALDRYATQWPAAVLACAIPVAMEQRGADQRGWCVRLALAHPEAAASALATLDPAVAHAFAPSLGGSVIPEADIHAIPKVLADPPWLRPVRQAPLPVVAVQPTVLPDRVALTASQAALARAWEAPHHLRNMAQSGRFPRDLLLASTGISRLLAGMPLQSGDVKQKDYTDTSPDLVLIAPTQAQLLLWNSYPPEQWSLRPGSERAVLAILGRYGAGALPGFVRLAIAAPEKVLPLAAGIDAPGLVEPMMRACRQLRKARGTAQHWLAAHAATAAAVALPLAFSASASSTRDDARHVLRWLVEHECAGTVRAEAARYGQSMQDALAVLLDLDPLLELPKKLPKLPPFFVPAAFHRPELKAGGALPLAAVGHLGMICALSGSGAPYPGLAQVQDACTPTSLAAFGWDVFEAWLTAGGPAKESWAFTALGLLGNDRTAQRLAPLIRAWPGESAHARAVAGLDILAAIGTDVALMHLNGIAGKVKFKALQERAREKIAAVAEARGFTPEELADRLVPDLGLEENGTVSLDFGPRRFTIGFDEALKPFVRDAQGARLKDLPKPLKSDDAALAEAATDHYKQMKKDAKAVASLQLTRLEMGMVSRRRWSAVDFRLFFLEHPLMRHLAGRLVWGVYAGERLSTCFRVAEDWTLADAQDNAFALADGATVGIAHVLEMGGDQLAAFGQLFADYEIQQPFRQLDRETFALTDDECRKPTLTRFADKTVATGSVLGLANRGWERGEAQDAGWVGWFTKRLPGGLQVDAQLDPGTVVGDTSYEPTQRVTELTLRRSDTWDSNGLRPFGELDPILASEVLRDIDQLAPSKE